MPPTNREADYLWNMPQAARRIQEFTEGISSADYLDSLLIQSAVERQIEIIGEAARRISRRFQQEHPQIPWVAIIGQGNVIAHQYEEIRPERIGLVIAEDIPVLIEQIEPLITQLPPDIE